MRYDPGRKAKTFSRAPQYSAEARFYKPNMKTEALEVELLKKNGTFVHSAAPLKVPTPSIVNHHSDKIYGTNDADCHSANTNPGFSRNPLGGFYTQIRLSHQTWEARRLLSASCGASCAAGGIIC